MRQVLLLDAGKAILNGALVVLGLGLFTQVLDGADEEAAGTAGGVEDSLAQMRIDLLDDELRDGAWGIKLAGISSRLKVFEDLFVDIAERVAVISLGVPEIYLGLLWYAHPRKRRFLLA